ncbi:MAG: DEAD/DEAH box helicase, partial [Dehalococcoidia bacterium]
MRFAEVAVDAPWTQQRTFSYSVPQGISLEVGHSVWVPFGRRALQGIVFDITPHPAVEETRDIISVIDPYPLLVAPQLQLARWISRHYRASLFDSTALMLPPGFRRRLLEYLSLRPGVEVASSSLTPAQSKVLDHLRAKGTVEVGAAKKALGAKAVATIQQLYRRGILDREWRWARPKVGPKYLSMVRQSVPKGQGAGQVQALRKGRAFQQAALMEVLLQEAAPISSAQLSEMGFSLSIARALEARGLVAIERVRVHRDPLRSRRFEPASPPTLTPDQREVWEAISRTLVDRGNREGSERDLNAFLLHGVTGSGKTELYLRALSQVVADGKRGLVLVPEISLTPQTIDRFGTRFPDRVAVLHSGLSLGEHFDEWWRIKGGEFDVVIGSRSAIFAPQPDLGLIVVDE